MRSSMIPPSGAQIIEYWARPMARLAGSDTRAAASASPASWPTTYSSPMCDRSNSPTACRTVRCSSMIELYWTGMSQPPNSISRAPSSRWVSVSGRDVDRRLERVGHGAASAEAEPAGGTSAVVAPGPAGSGELGGRPRDEGALGLEGQHRRPRRRTGSSGPRRTRDRDGPGRRRSDPSGSSGRSCGCACPTGRRCTRSNRAEPLIRTLSPVSSSTSRRAVSSRLSPAIGVPLGNVHVRPSRSRRRLPTTSHGAPDS